MDHGGQHARTGRYAAVLLRTLTGHVVARPQFYLIAATLAAIGCVAGTLKWIEFRTNRSDLIDPSEEFHQRWTAYAESFGDRSDLVVVFECDDPERIKAAVEELGERMREEHETFSHILYRIEPGALRRKGLQYLSPQQLESGLEKLKAFRPILEGRWERLRLDRLAMGLQLQLSDRLQRSTSDNRGKRQENEKSIDETLAHIAQLSESLRVFFRSGQFTNPWPSVIDIDPARQGQGQEVIYLMNEGGTVGFLKARALPSEDSFDGANAAIDRLRELIDTVSSLHRGVRISLTGIPVLESDEMRRSQEDMAGASVVSFALVGILLLVGFRGFRHPAIALFALATAVSWTFGYTTVVIGHLNILSVSFAAILIGLGIDFSIHYLARYLELRQQGHALIESLSDSSRSTGAGILTAAITTSAAFFCASFTEFLGVAELGIISGGGVMLCALATFIVVPAAIAIADSRTDPSRIPRQIQALEFRMLIAGRPFLVGLVATAIVITAGCQGFRLDQGRLYPKVAYDYNLLNLQAEGLESVEVQKRLFSMTNQSQRPDQGSLLFAVSIADSALEARQLREEYLRLSSVHHVEELGSRLPLYPSEETLLLVQGFDAQLAGLPDGPPESSPINPIDAGEVFESLLQTLEPLDQPRARTSHQAIDQFLNGLDQLELDEQFQKLMEFQQRLTRSLFVQLQSLRDAGDPEPVSHRDLPPELADRFVSGDGRWLVQVYPSQPIWDLEPLQEFVEECRSVDPDVTGTPLQNFEASRQIMKSYQNAAVYALGAVSFVLLIDLLGFSIALRAVIPSLLMTAVVAAVQHTSGNGFDYRVLAGSFLSLVGSLSLILDSRATLFTLLTLLPPVLGGFLMYGLLGMLDVDLNPANLIVLPLILGIGVDDGVHVVHDFREQTGHYVMSSSTMNAIVLTSLTSMIGFGSMMLAAHRGLFSLGLVLVIGVGSCLFVSLVPLPALLSLVRKLGSRRSESESGSRAKS